MFLRASSYLKMKNRTNIIFKKKEFDFTKKQLKAKDKIIIKFEGEILEISPAKFKKVINIEKEKDSSYV